ncbi:39S ribosomal protein L45 mitochondrial [Melia azedarach]|uniref:39S ribosomal protein L45 mitochondrial n=1 Tax=Melia azedarach TaxID=155640 RepID=A0ACC1Y8W5_MELAZ|nr:39S ribosomal protein L45 mitochondrial [Melia azedarach]
MAFLRGLQTGLLQYRVIGVQESSYLLGSSRRYSSVSNVPELYSQTISSWLCKSHGSLPWAHASTTTFRSSMAVKSLVFFNDKRFATTGVKAPAQARQMGALKVSMLSPGFIYEPYAPREAIPFWRRWFTRDGWRRTKEDIILELKSAYAIAKLRKSGYSKQKFYKEAVDLYKEINILMANGDKTSIRKAVTEKMYSALKNEIKQRESVWSGVYWELVEPIIKIRTLRARLIGVDRNDLNKLFVQLTLEFLAKQKFEAYDSKGAVVAGDKNKEVLVRDIWVFEKSLFHPGAYWRLCGRIKI